MAVAQLMFAGIWLGVYMYEFTANTDYMETFCQLYTSNRMATNIQRATNIDRKSAALSPDVIYLCPISEGGTDDNHRIFIPGPVEAG